MISPFNQFGLRSSLYELHLLPGPGCSARCAEIEHTVNIHVELTHRMRPRRGFAGDIGRDELQRRDTPLKQPPNLANGSNSSTAKGQCSQRDTVARMLGEHSTTVVCRSVRYPPDTHSSGAPYADRCAVSPHPGTSARIGADDPCSVEVGRICQTGYTRSPTGVFSEHP